MKLLEKDMEDLIIDNPQKYLKEADLKFISRQYIIGNYRFDLLFEDRHHGKLIVEIQRGTLDRNHTYKILDYFDEYKKRNPSCFVDLMIIANKITRERRDRLKSYGITFFEIPETVFLDDPNLLSRKQPGTKTHITEHNEINPKNEFNKLLQRGDWKMECTPKTELTLNRKEQLAEVFKIYNGTKIPLVHFEKNRITDPKLRNSQIYPIICAYHMGLLEVSNDSISLTPSFAKKFHQLFPEIATMESASTNNFTTAEKGIQATCKKIEQLGGTNITQIKEGNRRFITFASSNGREYKISVRAKSKSSYKWQSKTTYGRECKENPHESEYWVFVDLGNKPPIFYPIPLWWISNNIYEVFQEYLRKKGGHRPGNDDSTHHAVELEHIKQWEEKWDNIGL
jgi:hypothetical protein